MNSKKIKILFLMKRPGLGGTERVGSDFLKYLDRKKFNPELLISMRMPIKRGFENVEKITYLDEVEDLLSYIKKKKFEMVLMISFTHLSTEFFKEVRKIAKFAQIVNFTGKYSELRDANLITTMTDRYKIKLLQDKKLVNDYVLYHPIDTKKWVSLSKNKELKPYCKDKNKIIIGRLGRAEPSKWHYLVLATMKEFKKKKLFDKYAFLFVGMPKLYIWYLKLFLRKQLKNKQIILKNELISEEEIARFYKSLDLFFQASWIGESFGCVIAEAFSFKVPAITDSKNFIGKNGKIHKQHKKRYDAQLELIEEDFNGFYANYPRMILKKIRGLDKKYLKKLGSNGFKKTQELYAAKKITKNLENIIIKELLKKPGSNNLKIYPSKKEIIDYEKSYKKKLANIAKEEKKYLSSIYKLNYNFRERLFRVLEIIYLIFRKLLRTYFKYDIEKK